MFLSRYSLRVDLYDDGRRENEIRQQKCQEMRERGAQEASHSEQDGRDNEKIDRTCVEEYTE